MTRQTFCGLLPDRPYCTDALGGRLNIRRAEKAANCVFIQPNRSTAKRWMVFDIDEPGAWFLPEERGLPVPTYTAINRENGHAHVAYLLVLPVSFFDDSREMPIRYYKAVERAFTRRLGADRGYSGFLTKNPVHPRWETDWQSILPYRLDELNDCLEKADKRWTPRMDAESPTGRNVTVFDSVRQFAYREVIRFKKDGKTTGEFRETLLRMAREVNANNYQKSGLAFMELKGIAKSVAGFCWKRFTPEKFSAIQAARSRRRWTGPPVGKPWEAEGTSRATWYRRSKASLI